MSGDSLRYHKGADGLRLVVRSRRLAFTSTLDVLDGLWYMVYHAVVLPALLVS